jgi:alpha/beta superfamily hydrolase
MLDVRERPVTFVARGQPAFRLEGILHQPVRTDGSLSAAVVLCHPQPASSDYRDPLTWLLARELAAQGIMALRFNFRGVGNSEGQQTDGRLEPLDVAGAIEFILSQPGVNRQKLCLVGHGFGAFIALSYGPYDPRIGTIVAISLPMYRVTSGFGARFDRPKLFITGEFDEVCPRHKLQPYIEQLPGPRGLKIVTGARHLMRGYEDVAASAIITYIRRWIALPEPGVTRT